MRLKPLDAIPKKTWKVPGFGALAYGVKRENQIVKFASGKLRTKTIYRVRDSKGTRTGEIAGSNLRVRWIAGRSWEAI
jgi:hypothetical protein